jgi:leucyl aminopeptidase
VRQLQQAAAKHMCWMLDGDVPLDHFRQLVTGALLARYKFDEYKSDRRPKAGEGKLSIVAGKNAPMLRRELQRLLVLDDGVQTARDLANRPGADLVPEALAGFAQQLAKEHGLGFKKLSAARLAREGYVGLTAVGGGSSHPPVLFALMHEPKARRRGAKPLCLVGKGITFDSGGISIKPTEGMWDMKADMGGAACVIGAMQAVSSLKLPVPVCGVVAAAENLPGGRAYRPGDVLRYRNGRTVEIRSTDAEGRLVLADGLLYAQEVLKQKRIVEFSTLTGACVRALGSQYIGLMSRSPVLAKEVRQAARVGGEAVWELPLHPEYRLLIESEVADIKNTGGPNAGAQTAGWLLQEFIAPKVEFVHLDIAGVFIAAKKEKYWTQLGATGAGVRLAVALAEAAGAVKRRR